MGQYWMVVNVDKREFLYPHALGSGLKLWEQINNTPTTPHALFLLLACMPEARGGGDLESHPMIGRWVGDRVMVIGDYAENGDFEGDLPHNLTMEMLYDLCKDAEGYEETLKYYEERGDKTYEEFANYKAQTVFTDISEPVLELLKREFPDSTLK